MPPKVSVSLITYNHEPYIAQAIESVLAQETDFEIEVLIHDDASTDRTAEIVRAYERKRPDIIKPIYQTENQHSQGKKPGMQNCGRATGEYIATLEGDDYWIGPHKLQEQADFLDENPNVAMVFTNYITIDENGETTSVEGVPPEFRRDLDCIDILTRVTPHTATKMFRKAMFPTSYPDSYFRVLNGDSYSATMLSLQGRIAYLPITSACYRIHRGGIWSGRDTLDKVRRSLETRIAVYRDLDVPRREELREHIYTVHEKLLHYLWNAGNTAEWRKQADLMLEFDRDHGNRRWWPVQKQFIRRSYYRLASQTEDRNPLLSIVTRQHPDRPSLFQQHLRSLQRQDDPDYEHVVLKDTEGLGLAWANGMFHRERERVKGEYVLILDDDNALMATDVISEIRRVVDEHAPDVIVVKGYVGDRLLPDDAMWGKQPALGHIDSLNFVVRNEVWQKHIHAFDVPRCGDYAFISSVFKDNPKVYWLNKPCAKTLAINKGGGESQGRPGLPLATLDHWDKHIPADTESLLLCGCGTGDLGWALKQRKQMYVAGIEKHPRKAELARRVLDAVVEGNIADAELPFEQGQFDCIALNNLLALTPDPAALLKKLKPLLKDGGRFVLRFPNARFCKTLESLAEGRIPYGEEGVPYADQQRWFTVNDFAALCHELRLAPVELRPLSALPESEAPRAENGDVTVGRLSIHGASDREYLDLRTAEYGAVLELADPDPLGRARRALDAHDNEAAYRLADGASGANECARQRIMGKAMARLGKLDAAERHYRAALDAESDNQDAAGELGTLLVAKNNTKEAFPLLQRAAGAKRDDERTLGALGLCLLADGRCDEAFTSFLAALRIDFDNEAILYHAIQTGLRLGRLEEVEPLARQFVDLHPGNAEMTCNYALILKNLGRFDEARERLDMLLLMAPEHEAANGLMQELEQMTT